MLKEVIDLHHSRQVLFLINRHVNILFILSTCPPSFWRKCRKAIDPSTHPSRNTGLAQDDFAAARLSAVFLAAPKDDQIQYFFNLYEASIEDFLVYFTFRSDK
jgi:hypothetical protein